MRQTETFPPCASSTPDRAKRSRGPKVSCGTAHRLTDGMARVTLGRLVAGRAPRRSVVPQSVAKAKPKALSAR